MFRNWLSKKLRPENQVRQVAVYLLEDRAIVVPKLGLGGANFIMEPIFVGEDSPDVIQDLVLSGLAESRLDDRPIESMADSEDFKAAQKALFRAAGVRSWRALQRAAVFCSVVQRGQDFEVLPYKRAKTGGGYEGAGQPQTFNDDSILGDMVLRLLRSSS